MRIGKAYFKIIDLILLALSFLILLTTTVWLISHWESIPDIIPSHFDFSGNPDAEGAKSGIWLLPGMGWGIWVLFTVIEFFPGTWNNRSSISSAEGKAKAISLTRTFLEIIKLFIATLFSYLTICQAQGRGPTPLMVPLIIFLLMGATAVHVLLLARLK